MANDLRDKGIAIANEAVQSDNAGNYEDAIIKYCKAAEYLLTAIKYENNPVMLKKIREKCTEYTSRAETLKKGVDERKNPSAKKAAGGGAAGDNNAAEDSGDDIEETEPLTPEQLAEAEKEMEEELEQLTGMESVKEQMRAICKQLSLDIKRRQQGQNVLNPIRHMMFTGNPGTGKTTVSRLIAKLFKSLGVSSRDHVVEVQKGDLVQGYVNQTAGKTRGKIKEARGGILFVDEAYQLTQSLMRGQSDFSGEAIDEMMRVMNESGRKSTTFCFAGYKKEMEEFLTFNPGLPSRIKYRFHFDDYTVPDLCVIVKKKMAHKGYLFSKDAQQNLEKIIDTNTTKEMRSKYNGRLVDNLLQWANDALNERLPLDASGDDLITLTSADLGKAMEKFQTAKPPTKVDPTMIGSEEVVTHLNSWKLAQYSEMFVRAGYRQIFDLLSLEERDIRALGVTKDADVRRCLTLVSELDTKHKELSRDLDKNWMDPDGDIKTWLEKRDLASLAPLFEQHKIGFEVLGDLAADDLREIGVVELGPRKKLEKEIALWKEVKDVKRAEVIRAMMKVDQGQPATPDPAADEVSQRILQIRHSMGQLPV